MNSDRPAWEIITHLYASVLEFAGDTTQDDDLTAVIMNSSDPRANKRPVTH